MQIPPASIRLLDTLDGIDPARWNTLAQGHPLLRHEFLHALHETGCASRRTGWIPQYISIWQGESLEAAMPLYLKSHSRGEYVFDWAWADAYQRHGIDYYPKLLSAIPFSPVTGSRLLARTDEARSALIDAALELANDTSSLHVLFPTASEIPFLTQAGMMVRRGVQFHWRNENYRDFEQFLAQLSHDKRKKIRQERRKVREAGVCLERLTGDQIQEEHWDFFVRCYNNTYRAHHSSPYLNSSFFKRLGETMSENVLMVLANLDSTPVAAALNIFNNQALYGRYWGSIGYVSNLHFEACYYQAIEFCIEREIPLFEGGAQGEHKLARGFAPVETCSAHWLKHPGFADAVEKFLQRESAGIDSYMDELTERAPFRKN
jgi:uncharacterized protein